MTALSSFDFLCAILSLDESLRFDGEWQHRPGRANADWRQLVKLASQHWVSGAVYPALHRNGLCLPPDAQDYFEGAATLNRLRNARIRSEALAIAITLNEIGVVPIFLKGSANLLSELYPDTAMRMMVDLDILVPAARLPECAKAIEAEGYLHLFDSGFPDHHHYSPLGRPDGEAAVELHVDPLHIQYQHLLSSTDIFQHAEYMSAGRARFAVPAAWCRVVHCIAHAQFSNQALIYGRLPLRDLIDTILLNRTGAVDWRMVFARFASPGEQTALAYHLLAADRLLGAKFSQQLPFSRMAELLYSRARFLCGHPLLDRWTEMLLWPWLELWRSLSHPRLRRRFLCCLLDPAWHARQWHGLFHGGK